MPGFNATGPRGQGPGSGWGLGPCGAGLRHGGGRGRSRGFSLGAGGFRRGYGSCGFGPFSPGPVAAGSSHSEITTLRQEASALKAELESVQKRLAELEGAQP